jgi:hypothetical protein
MRTFLITSLFIMLFAGCTHQNAFTRFHISQKEERTEESIQTVKITLNGESVGLATVVYLNKVMPKIYYDKEYFYLYYYLKDKEAKIEFLLNNKRALDVKELPSKNRFSNLTSFNASWSQYRLVVFKKAGNVLKFTIKTDKAAKATLEFVKDK